MEKKTEISALLKNFQDEKISPEELSVLYASLQKGSDEIDSLISSEWEKTSPLSHEIDSEKVLLSIHKKGQFKTEAAKPTIQKQNSLKISMLQYTRYAAIFLIAFAIAWLLRTPKNTSNSGNTTNVAVAYGSKSTIELPDGSLVVLNSGSKLTYPTSFGKDNRTVFLSGEGFFEVRKNTKWPFFVKTSGMTVKVTGTKFNVKAYPDESLTETTLVSGSVEILEEKKEKTPKLLAVLKPNQKAVFNRENVMVEQSQKENQNIKPREKIGNAPGKPIIDIEESVKTEDLTCWKNNVLIINNEKLSDLSKKLERWYNVEISVKSDALANIRFSGKFDKETIQEVLNALMFIQPFSYDINKNKIIIRSKFNQ
jgi:ferric-dicitrate binding protein FerR (iron transport regulator)